MDDLKAELGKEYVDYYRHCVRYVMENKESLTAIPVLFQNFGIELPDLQARKIKLSEVASPVVMVYFWTAADAS